jgi:hypothetical protein
VPSIRCLLEIAQVRRRLALFDPHILRDASLCGPPRDEVGTASNSHLILRSAFLSAWRRMRASRRMTARPCRASHEAVGAQHVALPGDLDMGVCLGADGFAPQRLRVEVADIGLGHRPWVSCPSPVIRFETILRAGPGRGSFGRANRVNGVLCRSATVVLSGRRMAPRAGAVAARGAAGDIRERRGCRT